MNVCTSCRLSSHSVANIVHPTSLPVNTNWSGYETNWFFNTCSFRDGDDGGRRQTGAAVDSDGD